MSTYACNKCGMSVNATCGKCNTPLVNGNLKLESELGLSKVLENKPIGLEKILK